MIAHVFPPAAPLSGVIDPPSSKNFTTRYLLASCLAEGHSVVRRPAVQDDAVALVGCCRAMGATIRALDRDGAEVAYEVENDGRVERLEIIGFGAAPRLRHSGEPLNPGNAGAVFRMVMAVSALLPEVRWETDYVDSLGKRPNIDLLEALERLGVEVEYAGGDGCLPITLRGGAERILAHLRTVRQDLGIAAHDPVPIEVSGAVSSQYTSALMFLAPLIGEDIELRATGRLKSLPLIETTRNVLSAAGIEVESSEARHIHRIRAGQKYQPRVWETNGDWPGSSAILAAAAVVPGSHITVRRLYRDEQGEKECVPFFEKMGCSVSEWTSEGADPRLEFRGPAGDTLEAASVNGDLCTDAVLAMMGAALVARGNSRFVQIRNLQFKECDRVREPIAELRKVWATALPGERVLPGNRAIRWEPDDDPDTIHVTGAPQGFEGGIEVDGRGDHRVIMMLSIVALRCRKGLRIRGAEHVSKSFPAWFDVLAQMGVRVEFTEEKPGTP